MSATRSTKDKHENCLMFHYKVTRPKRNTWIFVCKAINDRRLLFSYTKARICLGDVS